MLYLGLPIIQPPTYQAVCGIAPAVLATDILTMFGSATKTVAILNIWIDGVQATGSQVQFGLIRRSAQNTGGTAFTVQPTSQDQNDSQATASVLMYSVNPSTLGAVVGNIKADRVYIPLATAASYAAGILWSFNSAKNIILRGINQGIALNLGGVSIIGGALNVTIEFIEY